MKKLPENDNILAPVLALDLGKKRVGAAVSDALSISITRLQALPRTNWKQLLRDVDNVIRRFDARTVVIGFPLRLNGSCGEAASEARKTAEKFARSLQMPVYLQDERLTSFAAEQTLRAVGLNETEVANRIDSESAAVILKDFLDGGQDRILISGGADD